MVKKAIILDESKDIYSLIVDPNPVVKNFVIEFFNPGKSKREISLLDTNGRLLRKIFLEGLLPD